MGLFFNVSHTRRYLVTDLHVYQVIFSRFSNSITIHLFARGNCANDHLAPRNNFFFWFILIYQILIYIKYIAWKKSDSGVLKYCTGLIIVNCVVKLHALWAHKKWINMENWLKFCHYFILWLSKHENTQTWS